jgi:hypothetical protein
MRTSLLFIAGAALLAPACKWTDFDDLEKETWVSTITKPNSDSTDFGIALARGASTGSSGGKLAALGSAEVVYTEITFASNGDYTTSPGQNLSDQYGISNLEAQPIFLADPGSNEVALIMEGGGNQVVVFHGQENLNYVQVFGVLRPDTATFLTPPPPLDNPTPQISQPLIGYGDHVFGAGYPSALNPQPQCRLLDEGGAAVQVRGLGAVKLTNTDSADPHDVVVWSADGKLRLYTGGVFHGAAPRGPCTSNGQSPLAGTVEVATGYQPGRGSQIVMIADRYALLVGRKEIGNPDSFIALYDLRATNGDGDFEPAQIGNPVTTPDLRTATVYDDGSQMYVVAGYPNAMVDSVRAGNVIAYPLDLSTGIDSTPAMILHDAHPESDQQFGRAVAVTEINGRPVIAVGADNEVFLYFRTALYDDVRQ